MNITLFGEELELVRPKGIEGLKFMPKAHRAFQRLMVVIGPVESKAKDGANEYELTAETLGMINELITTEGFLTDVLPGFYRYSTLGLSQDKAIAKINKQEISTETTLEIFLAFMNAMNFWGQSKDSEALDAAIKKLTGDDEETEEPTL